MKKKCKEFAHRLLALLLCVSMLLPMIPQIARAESDSASSDGTSTLANSGILSIEDELKAEDATAVYTNTAWREFTPVTDTVANSNSLVQNEQYIIASADNKYVMSYDARDKNATSAATGSLVANQDFYLSSGNIILDHSNRNNAMWIFRQYAQGSSGVELANGTNLSVINWDNFGDRVVIYQGMQLQKGRSDIGNGEWWYNNGSTDEYRYLDYRSKDSCFKNQDATVYYGTNDLHRFCLESFSDGTYLFYYKFDDSGTDYRIICCDENGEWQVKQYKDISGGATAKAQILAELDSLKVRIYHFNKVNFTKKVAYSGYQTYRVGVGTDTDTILNSIQENITVFDTDRSFTVTDAETGETTTKYLAVESSGTDTMVGRYRLALGTNFDTAEAGQYLVNIYYVNDYVNGVAVSDTFVGSVTVVVEEPISASISQANKTGTVSKNASISSPVYIIDGENSTKASFDVNGETKYITVGMLTDSQGKLVDTTKAGIHTDLTLTYQGTVICTDFTLTVAESTLIMDYPVYPNPGSVKVDKGTTTTEDAFSTTGVANIELSATAKPVEKGVDLIIVVDLSSSMLYGSTTGTYVATTTAARYKYNPDGSLNTSWGVNSNWTQTRLYEMEQALKEMVETLQNSEADVRIAMTDFGDLDNHEFKDSVLDDSIRAWPHFNVDGDETGTLEYEFSNHLNFVLSAHDDDDVAGADTKVSQPFWLDKRKYNTTLSDYTGKVIPTIYTGSKQLDAGAFQNVNELDIATIIDTMDKVNGKRVGTNYDVGLEYAYRLGYAAQQENIANGEERDIVCIFMSDGAAMQYNYFSGRSQTDSWSQFIIGETDSILANSSDENRTTLSSNPDETTNPYLRAMMKDLLNILKVGNLIIPGTTTTYKACASTETDFFEAMASIGVECDWDLFFKIAYKLYTHHSDRTLTLEDGSIVQYDGKAATGVDLLKAVVLQLRVPNDKATAQDASGKIYQTLSPYYYFYNTEGKNWWAEAIKGDTDKLYPVINRFAFENSTEWPLTYYGDVRNNFDTETGLALDGKDYIAGYRGLGMDLYTIGFALASENMVSYEEASKVLDNVASGTSYHYEASTGGELNAALQSIVSTVSTSATKAYFTDTMGDDYDLSTEKTVVDENGNVITVNATPTIRVLEYTLDADGNRTGSFIEREVITFEDMDGDGDVDAWSSQVYTTSVDANNNTVKTYTDIWDESTNMITGKFVRYNANEYVDESNTGAVDLYLDDTGRKFTLNAETFFWTIGVIGETEMVLEYQVYLTGSLEGDLPAYRDYYDTNEEAVLNYVNYLGNNCSLSTIPPQFPWGDGNLVGYSFYLVNEYGVPIDHVGNFEGIRFDGSMKLMAPKYVQVGEGVESAQLLAETLFNDSSFTSDYELYNTDASYEVDFTNLYWETDGSGTTYVTNFGGSGASNAPNSAEALAGSPNLKSTVVYFPVMRLPEEPDIEVDKKVEESTTEGEYILTLEGYASGEVTEVPRSKPADIVLVLDHSGSMYSPVGSPAVLKSGEALPSELEGTEIDRGALLVSKAKHLGYYVCYDRTDGYWYIMQHSDNLTSGGAGWLGYKVLNTEAIIVPGQPSNNGYNQIADVEWAAGTVPSTLVFYKSQYAMLYDSVLSFVKTLKASGAEHNVSIVGFAGSDSTQMFLGIQEDGQLKKSASYYAMIEKEEAYAGRHKELYQAAMKNVQDATEYEELLTCINLIETNYSYTCPAAGLVLANEIFKNNEINLAERDRIVVLFTDGIPNRMIGEGVTVSGTEIERYNEIVSTAYTTKGLGAKVYSVSTSTLGTDDRTFLNYISSDFPSAVDYSNPGTQVSDNYTMQVNNLSDMEIAFGTVTDRVTSTTVKLDDEAIMKDILSEYFELPGNVVSGNVNVYTQAYLGNGEWAEKVPFDHAFIVPTVSEDGSGRIVNISVTGFNYAEEYIAEAPRTITVDGVEVDYYGSKLVVEIIVKTRDGFWGGNNVPTNDSNSAIYKEEIPVVGFPVPEVNVPLEPVVLDVTTKNKVIYYGGNVTSAELFDKATIDGVEVIIDADGNVTPAQSWMDDFVSLEWTSESTIPGETVIDNKASGDYPYIITMTPTYDGFKNNSENPSNLYGKVITEQTVSDTAHVTVLVPVLNYQDSVIELGELTDEEYYENTNRVGEVIWVDMDAPFESGVPVPGTPTDPDDVPPTLSLFYSPDSADGNYFTSDTLIDVTVKAIIGDSAEDITDQTWFMWEDCTSPMHDEGIIRTHLGSASSNEFVVHVNGGNDPTLSVHKFVTATDEKDKFTLTLEAYATGGTLQIPTTKAADIVLVLDQSSTMYTPAGVDADRIYADSSMNSTDVNNQLAALLTNGEAMTGSAFRTKAKAEHDKVAADPTYESEFLQNAQHLGYYVAKHNTADYLYVVQLVQYGGKWNWYYYCCSETTKSVTMDFANPTTSSEYGKTVVLSANYGFDYEGTEYDVGYSPFDTNFTYYVSQYGALYDTLKQFVTNLHETAQETGVDHNVAIVGFSSPFYDGWDHYDGTGVYIDGQYYLFDSDYAYQQDLDGDGVMEILDPDATYLSSNPSPTEIDDSELDYQYLDGKYGQALVNVKDEEGLESLLASIEGYNANYQQTCPSIGITIAEAIFAARDDAANGELTSIVKPTPDIVTPPANLTEDPNYSTYDEDEDHEHAYVSTTANGVQTATGYQDNAADRDEVIILFTDGYPTVRCTTDRYAHGFGNHYVNAEFWSIAGGSDDAVDHANEAKSAGISIYTVGTSRRLLVDDTGTETVGFLDYVSSNYPNATSTLVVNETWAKGTDGYYFLHENTKSGAIAYFSTGELVESPVNYSMYATDEGFNLSVAFKTIYNSIVSTVPLDGTAVLKEMLSDYFVLDPESMDQIKTYTADFTGIDADGKYLFSDTWTEFDATVELESSESDGRLDTILVSGFSYEDEYCAVENGVTRGRKLIVQLTIRDREGFWGGNNIPTNEPETGIYTKDEEPIIYFPIPQVNIEMTPELSVSDKTIYYSGDVNSTELLDTITIDGVEVIVNDDGTLSPAAPWMDDFATLTWNENSTIPGQSVIDNENPDSYTYGVTLTPINDGSVNTSDRPSNIEGTPAEDKSSSGDANVKILVPVVTFKDSTIVKGESTSKTYYDGTNLVDGIIWVDMQNPQDENGGFVAGTPTDENATAPTLDYQYSTEGAFTADTPVDVTVLIGTENITDKSWFQWVDCNKDHDDIATHLGSETSKEFIIHVIYLNPDAVVIDFGIPVDINILGNDTLHGATFVGMLYGDLPEGLYTTELDAAFLETLFATDAHGKLSLLENGKLRYESNDMVMPSSEQFVYAVAYTEDGVTRYLYTTVTVIPATTIYFEDTFSVDYTVYSVNDDGTESIIYETDENGNQKLDSDGDSIKIDWNTIGITQDAIQNEDRPGTSQLVNDANKIYGYDDAYSGMSQYSMGSAHWINVSATQSARAKFTFTGTGFDVISLSSSATGTIIVSATKTTDSSYVKYYMVDTYYGYTYGDDPSTPEEENVWYVNSGDNTLYQVPVIKVEDLDYATYDVEIYVAYNSWFDNTGIGSYDFYLDAIRIYNPADKDPADEVVKDAYDKDGELWPEYHELRNLLINANSFDQLDKEDEVNGIVFIDGIPSLNNNSSSSDTTEKMTAAIADYANYGPNNELYLQPGQAVAFKLDLSGTANKTVQNVHLALKSVGGTANIKVYNASTGVNQADVAAQAISTATDLYYSLNNDTMRVSNGDIVVIYNCGAETDAILSVTNLKITYTAVAGTDYEDSGELSNVAMVSQPAMQVALASLSEPVVAPTLNLSYPTVSFEDEIFYNVYFDVDDMSSVTEMGLITFDSKLENGTIEDAKEVIPGYTVVDGAYTARTNGIPAKNMGDAVYFKAYAKLSDGTYVYSDIAGYNAVAYAKTVLNSTVSDSAKALVVAMLNYGAAAQVQFGYNTDSLMNASLTAEQQALVNGYSADMMDALQTYQSTEFVKNTEGFTSLYPSVSFEGAFSINFYAGTANVPDGDVTFYYWDAATLSGIDDLTADNATGSVKMTADGELYGAAITGIAAKEMDKTVAAVVVFESNGVSYCSGPMVYSVGSYCESLAAGGNVFAEAIAVYGYYAKSYFAN